MFNNKTINFTIWKWHYLWWRYLPWNASVWWHPLTGQFLRRLWRSGSLTSSSFLSLSWMISLIYLRLTIFPGEKRRGEVWGLAWWTAGLQLTSVQCSRLYLAPGLQSDSYTPPPTTITWLLHFPPTNIPSHPAVSQIVKSTRADTDQTQPIEKFSQKFQKSSYNIIEIPGLEIVSW